MTTSEAIRASADRVKRARDRLIWQQRLLARAEDPVSRRIAERMMVTLAKIVETLQETHDLLLELERRRRRDPDDQDE